MAADLTPAVVLVHRTNARNEQRPIDRVCDERKRLFGRQQNHRTVTDLHWSDRGMSLASIVRPVLAVHRVDDGWSGRQLRVRPRVSRLDPGSRC